MQVVTGNSKDEIKWSRQCRGDQRQYLAVPPIGGGGEGEGGKLAGIVQLPQDIRILQRGQR